MKLLHTSDWHLGHLLFGYERTEEHTAFLEQLTGIIRAEKPDAMLLCGDVFHYSNPSAASQRLYTDALLAMHEAHPAMPIIVTGMGGAGFPTFIKLCPPPTAKAECVILNGVECEPYITSDYRLMMEHADEILVGLDLLMKAVKVNKGYIGIEENKPAAIQLFEEKTKGNPNVEIVPLAKKYPQGGEKQLVDAVIRRQVPAPPAIPVNVGAVVQNVGTAYAVYQAVMKNKPLFERYTTVTGKKLAHPANFLVRMGTPMIDLINECGGMPEGDNKLLAGGPMMGKALTSVEVPICKGTNSVTILSGDEAKRKPAQPCIRCAKCVSACPMGLEPYLLATASALHDWEKVEAAGVTSCIECGSCQFTCPAHRPMLDNIRLGKSTVMGLIKARNAKK